MILKSYCIPMKLNLGETEFSINITFALCVTLMLIIDESGIAALALFCCIVHEAAHILCLRMLGEYPASVKLSFYGIKLERRPYANLGKKAEIAVYACGPAANFLLAAIFMIFSVFAQSLKTAALISFMTGAFNLLPCSPLDGGNILKCILGFFCDEEKSDKINFLISFGVLIPMTVAAIFLTVKTGNITFALVTAYLLGVSFLNKKEKGNIKL